MRELNTTSFLILGMLANRDWSAYQIAEQISRGAAEIWPRANRGLYDAPKRLVEHGYATSSTAQSGGRRRTVYSITPAGMEALSGWLSRESNPSALEFEGLLRVILADRGDLDALRNSLQTIADQSATSRDQFAALAEQMLDASSRMHPERLHLMAVANRFMVGHFCHLHEWALWALDETANWDDTVSPSRTRGPEIEQILNDSIRLASSSRRADERASEVTRFG